jgi:hypothetical protein
MPRLFTPRTFPASSAYPTLRTNAKDGPPDSLCRARNTRLRLLSLPVFHHLGWARRPMTALSKNIPKEVHRHRDFSTALPRISCRDSWLRSFACGSLYGEQQTWALLAARGRKSGCASVEMTKGSAVTPRSRVPGNRQTAGPSTAIRSFEKHLQGMAAEPQVPPLRSFGAPVGMTSGGGMALPENMSRFSSAWAGRRPLIPPGRDDKVRVARWVGLCVGSGGGDRHAQARIQ